ncbi:DUF5615 family PIN-like protein [Halorubrum ezzemoulense]|uniref:DUF5615 family PIN-like protein n=1 Tax=Halorubrum ezzemoulense TaxID=337243 RepID=UPI0023EE2267|nr:DUF5615 family PIN-like protein [Halorubrum ezzemoulense]
MLADVNVPEEYVSALRGDGHDVVYSREISALGPEATDDAIVEYAACNRLHPTSLGLAASLVEGGALIWFSLSVGATGRLVRPAYRTPFGVDKPTIQGRATAARTARHLWTHSTD